MTKDLTWVPPRVEADCDADELAAIEAVIASGPFDATWESLSAYETPRWFREAKFGVFVHWGAYSVPAYGSEWYARRMYKEGSVEFAHHRETWGDHREVGYKDFLPQLTFENFDASAMVTAIRRSGARFIVPVAEHHDGFCMYDEPRTRWKAPLVGPRRDPLGELLSEARDQWMTVGASSHRAENWFYFNGGRSFPSDVADPEWSDLYGAAEREEIDPSEAFLRDWLIRTVHIIDRYRPQVLWFDWWIERPAFEPYLRTLAAYYYNRSVEWGHGVVLQYKNDAFREGTAVFDVERGASSGIRPLPWQNDTSVSRNSWGWIDAHDYKESREIISDLIDVVAKNGCLLLNVGPKPDGTLPPEEVRLLEQVGDWLALNGEGVFGTEPWLVYGEGPTSSRDGSFVDDTPFVLVPGDLRFTRRSFGDVEYLYVLAAQGDVHEIDVRALGSHSKLFEGDIAGVQQLGSLRPLQFERAHEALRVSLPPDADTSHGFGIRITLRHPAPTRRRDDLLHN
ncbi:alpha-L-fucosidase [Agromyces rhizosphaerae]|uniref:alpha-L-fucosidase n=1 Tax=Agromyces rhizosphaerae TaxID=88374 RepID=A0A9W6CV65_9MICO|nr:alpha-L-fucosidase [Agromyces rhizosphaerae]GLI26661.1 alpha-L-fucosidase [Agromyces rhizosphaerae]